MRDSRRPGRRAQVLGVRERKALDLHLLPVRKRTGLLAGAEQPRQDGAGRLVLAAVGRQQEQDGRVGRPQQISEQRDTVGVARCKSSMLSSSDSGDRAASAARAAPRTPGARSSFGSISSRRLDGTSPTTSAWPRTGKTRTRARMFRGRRVRASDVGSFLRYRLRSSIRPSTAL